MTLALEIERERKAAEARGESRGRLESIRNLMKNMKLSAEQAMITLGVPREDFEKYSVLL